jgi:FkbM family methyltransferase
MTEREAVYDVGAHKGGDTAFYLKKGFSVVAIEASPELCEGLKRRSDVYLRDRQLAILNVAISNISGTTDLYLDPDAEPNAASAPADPDHLFKLRMKSKF